jgi:hypothetical protein
MQRALTPTVRPEPARVVVALLSVAAAYVHLAYTQSHWQEWWAYGAFFLAAAVGQALFAPAVICWRAPGLLLAGIAGNLAIAGMYLLSRTSGPPLGPHAHVIEPARSVDLVTAAAEIGLVGLLVMLLADRAGKSVINVLVLAGAVLWGLRLTGHLA